MIRETLGEILGKLWAPAVGAIARARHARMFHPDGQTFVAHFEPAPGGPFEDLAQVLGRTVLARMSPALWRNGAERFEVLGIALRFHRGARVRTKAEATDQDLLFATIRSPFTMGLAPLTTDAHDFLRNRYFAVCPFELPSGERVKIRLSPADAPVREGTRGEKLSASVLAGEAVFAVELRRTWRRGWARLGTLTVEKPSHTDQAALRFDPFQTGAGITPVGVIQAARKATYAASQAARPASDGEREILIRSAQ
ncbi:MAG TPA: hypothetical protein VGM88_06695 [Kofleriaceae bacterium]|jgi:hypothetical protein